MKASVSVMCHKDADPNVVSRLIHNQGGTLIASVQANAETLKTTQACLYSADHMLYVGARDAFALNGVKLPCGVAFGVLGMPNDCELVDVIAGRCLEPAIDIEEIAFPLSHDLLFSGYRHA